MITLETLQFVSAVIDQIQLSAKDPALEQTVAAISKARAELESEIETMTVERELAQYPEG